MTFDDGPTPGVTEWILDELARWDARATFFCLGRNVEAHPGLYARIVAGGHRVGNHTHNHMKGWGCGAAIYAADVDRAAGVTDSDLFRPPYGRTSPAKAFGNMSYALPRTLEHLRARGMKSRAIGS
ncbi:MAG: polysaccharide deacetylase family protein [Alistipes sp.]|nr:polysaccharide deacetylase family protein [Alistipes sp.]